MNAEVGSIVGEELGFGARLCGVLAAIVVMRCFLGAKGMPLVLLEV